MKQALKNMWTIKGYRMLLIKLAAFLVLFAALDFAMGGILKQLYFKQRSGWEYRTKYSIEDTKADILIFGASRAQQQYNPVYFEERLNQTCYNVGRDGEPIFYFYGVLKAVLKRYTPKTIILDVENKVFKASQSSYDRLAVLLPFYKDHPEMRPVIELRSDYEKYKLLSGIYPYNSMLFKLVVGNLKPAKKGDDIQGYVPLKRALHEPIRTVDFRVGYDLDSNKINTYKAFIKDCLDANIKLYLVCSPHFINAIGADTSMVLAKQIAAEKNICFIDFSKDQRYLSNSALFDDTVHVNTVGSKIFSNQLIDTLLLKQ